MFEFPLQSYETAVMTDEREKRPFILFFISNLPYYGVILFSIAMLILIISKLFSELFNMNIEFNVMLTLIFKPFLLLLVLSTTIISILLYVYFFFDCMNNKDMPSESKVYWKKIFIIYPVFVNSLYFDFKYPRNENFFLFEKFIMRSRDRILKRL